MQLSDGSANNWLKIDTASNAAGNSFGSGATSIGTYGTGNMTINSLYSGTSYGAVNFQVSSVPSGVGNHAVTFTCAAGTPFISESGTFVPVSDRTLKRNIEDCTLSLPFIRAVKPRKFQMLNDGPNEPLNHGFIAQEIEQACIDGGFTDFGGVISPQLLKAAKPSPDNGKTPATAAVNTSYCLNYQDFIAILTKCVQDLDAEVTLLRAKVGI